ncbi:hypothetical protein EV121DRAFT_287095 [Schizophyllum commune]
MSNPAQLAHGPMLIGLVFNVLLYGIMITQLYLYVTTYKRDPLWIKIYVAVLFVADTFNTVCLMVYMYDALIIHFGDTPFLDTANWVFATDPVMTAFIGSMVQSFFAWRIRVLNMSWMFWVPAAVCAFIGAAGGLSTSIAIHFVSHFSEFQKFEIAVIFWLVAAAVGDVFITVALTKYLREHYTGYRATDDRIDGIIRLTVQTGMITAVWAIIDLGVYLGDPTGTHLIFNLPLSKLYSNTLLSSLNARGGWKPQASTVSSGGDALTSPRMIVGSGTHPDVLIERSIEHRGPLDLHQLSSLEMSTKKANYTVDFVEPQLHGVAKKGRRDGKNGPPHVNKSFMASRGASDLDSGFEVMTAKTNTQH